MKQFSGMTKITVTPRYEFHERLIESDEEPGSVVRIDAFMAGRRVKTWFMHPADQILRNENLYDTLANDVTAYEAASRNA